MDCHMMVAQPEKVCNQSGLNFCGHGAVCGLSTLLMNMLLSFYSSPCYVMFCHSLLATYDFFL